MEKELLDYDPEKVMPDVGDDLKKDKERNKELATYRYSDKAIFNFVDEMKNGILKAYLLLRETIRIFSEIYATRPSFVETIP